jgi:hypothetical protein
MRNNEMVRTKEKGKVKEKSPKTPRQPKVSVSNETISVTATNKSRAEGGGANLVIADQDPKTGKQHFVMVSHPSHLKYVEVDELGDESGALAVKIAGVNQKNQTTIMASSDLTPPESAHDIIGGNQDYWAITKQDETDLLELKDIPALKDSNWKLKLLWYEAENGSFDFLTILGRNGTELHLEKRVKFSEGLSTEKMRILDKEIKETFKAEYSKTHFKTQLIDF